VTARLVDVHHLGRARVIGCWVVDDEVLVDPGPAVSVATLVGQLDTWRPRAIAITHLHLDHAGATGDLVRRWPGTEVWVHERAAPHLVHPAGLLLSAAAVYGRQLERLWGFPAPVPEEVVRPLCGGERVGPFSVLHTPGHAGHHLSYLHLASGVVFAGDAAGTRIPPSELVVPATVPPDTDVDRWLDSLRLLREAAPAALALAHFGLHRDVLAHLERAERFLALMVERSRHDRPGFERWLASRLAALGDAETAAAYRQATHPETFWTGLARGRAGIDQAGRNIGC